jgi:hypothetical protein
MYHITIWSFVITIWSFVRSTNCVWRLCFFLFGAILSQPCITFAEAPPLLPYQPDRQLLSQVPEMIAPELPTDTTIRYHDEYGTITFLKALNLSVMLEQEAEFRTLQATKRYGDIVLRFLTRYRQLFKLREPMQEFVITSINSDHLGFTHVRLQQQFAGIVVWGSELIGHINPEQHLYLIQGHYIPTPEQVQTSPVLTEDDALRVAAQALDRTPSECPKCEAKLMIFAAAYQPPRLSYRVEVSTGLTERWSLIIDAINGAVLEQQTMISNPGPVLKRQ